MNLGARMSETQNRTTSRRTRLDTQLGHHPHRGHLLLRAIPTTGWLPRRLSFGRHDSILVSKVRSLRGSQGDSGCLRNWLAQDEIETGERPGLTKAEREELAVYIQRVSQRGIGVLLVDHNLPLIRATCSRLYVLSNGRVIAQGAPDAVFTNAEVISAYLGVAV